LRAEAGRLGLARRVHFAGRVMHDEVPAHLAAIDIAISPRSTFYASPLKIVEYMAMGKAIVAPAMRNIEDLLTHERSALLFAPEDGGALAAAIGRLVAEPALRRALGTEARRLVEDGFTWHRNAREVVKLAGRLHGGAHALLPVAG